MTPSTKLKMAALAPIPSASVRIGDEREARAPRERSEGQADVADRSHDHLLPSFGALPARRDPAALGFDAFPVPEATKHLAPRLGLVPAFGDQLLDPTLHVEVELRVDLPCDVRVAPQQAAEAVPSGPPPHAGRSPSTTAATRSARETARTCVTHFSVSRSRWWRPSAVSR